MEILLDDFLLARQQLPVIDVRSEGEFDTGHIQAAFNIPLLNNAERVAVGTLYKQQGQRSAIREGFRLVGPRLAEMVDQAEKLAAGRELLIHCWRGGMRSGNFASFVRMAGVRARTLKGGYKVYRTRALETFRKPLRVILLTGYTGSGKSDVLRALGAAGEQILDLEGMAHHKGSAFGHLLMPPQPTTEQFQNDLFEAILKLDPSKPVWVEDESIAIGKIFLPTDFWQQMMAGHLVKMDVSKEVRISRLVAEYGPADREAFLAIMQKITKKLGGQNFNAAKERLLAGDMPAVMDLLLTYYDKAYHASISRREERILFNHSWDGQVAEALAKSLQSELYVKLIR